MRPQGRGLTALEAVQQKLEEDQRRAQRVHSRRPAQTPPTSARGAAAGGAARAASYLRAVAGGRVPAFDSEVDASHLCSEVEVAVLHPPAQMPMPAGDVRGAEAAERSSSAGLPAGGGGPGDLHAHGFLSNRDNFLHILHFLRDGPRWQPPELPEECAALRSEALYFGCPALVQRLDALDGDGHRAGEGGRGCGSPAVREVLGAKLWT
uniref:Uncharacterized protein n=1 Tax=Alexandrium monilatum TaxID=311494 RepID=A0A7S4RRF8_9DINO